MLALFSGGDLPWKEKWRMRRHVNRCEQCEQRVAEFRASKTELRREAQSQTLTAFEAIADWSVLEREMLGNIAVGVAAARCVDKVRRGRSFLIKGTVSAALATLFVAGWITHIPREQTAHLASSIKQIIGLERPQIAGTQLKTVPDGIAVRAQGATLTILHPASAVVSVSGPSSMSARYVDEETGQVTITKVYAQ
jgi:anti-sigma factor RsiW